MKTTLACALVPSLFALVCAACGSSEKNTEPEGESGNGGSAGTLSPSAGTNAAGNSTGGSGTAGSGGSSAGGAGSTAGGKGGGGGSAGVASGAGGSGGEQGGNGPLAGSGGVASGAGGEGAGGTAQGGAGGASGAAGGGELQGDPKEEMLVDLPTVRQEHSVAAAAGEVYVIGGYTPNISASVLAYDPDTEMWRERADFPAPMNHGNAATVADKIYVSGFYVGGMSTASGQTFVYDPAEDEWSELSPMPVDTERAAACTAVLDTKIYIFGGSRDNGVVDDVSVYDTATDSWETLPPLPETREHCVAGAIGGKLYVGGGRTHTIPEFRPNTYEFDPEAKAFTAKKPITTPRGGVAGGVLGNRLFVVGGEGNTAATAGVFENVEAYSPATDTWEEFPPLIEPRHGMGAAVLDGRLYVPGGAERQGADQYEGFSVYFFE